jgi:glycosyltransferase involved in cell wall biosynthesis
VRILILNWRCPKNPRAGGAELFTHEIAKRLAAGGDQVEWFSASFPGALSEEDLDGVHFVRAGHQATVHLNAFRRYRRRLRSSFDLVIDEVNTIPFFTPIWADIPVVMLIFQLAREVWWYESRFPLSLLGFLLEPVYLKLYKRQAVITESGSTRSDLKRVGLSGPITVIPVGVDHHDIAVTPRGAYPAFVYVGRLSPSKRVADIVRAFHIVQTRNAHARLELVGDGPTAHVRALKRLVQQLGLSDTVHFSGRVTPGEKYARIARSHALVMASVREGWGLVVSEASACGTPTVAYDVPGLRDSVQDGKTGLLVAPTPPALAAGMLRIWEDKQLRHRLAEQGLKWSQTLSYETSTELVRSVMIESIANWARRGSLAN